MEMKKLVLLNVFWALIAAGAFFVGNKKDQGSVNPDQTADQTNNNYSGSDSSLASGSGRSSKAPGSSSLVSKNKGGALENINSLSGELSRRISAALVDPDPIRRNASVSQMLLELDQSNVSEILSAFENAPGGRDNDRFFNDFLFAWARISGEEAVKYAMDPESPKRTRGDEVTAVSGWAAVDPDAARQFVDGVENSDVRQWMHLGVLREMVQSDLDGAISYSEQNVKSRARGEQMDRIAEALVKERGEQALIDWINGIDHTKKENDMLSYKSYAVRIALDRTLKSNPEMALQFVTDNAQEPYLTSDTLERASRAAGDSMQEEMQWLVNLPEQVKGQRHAIGERFEEFIRDDFVGAGEWLASQPLGPAYDEAIQDYAISAAKDDPEAALAWVDRITDERLKNYTLGRLKPKEPRDQKN
ncbi:MAG: hypothetical protein VX646_03410 [Verrucomicrobiota bacterium]|nr:hypothetical protein [Verrucomicrobiota bacterium]MEE2966905.1 hypothetical protein [Verrucomicrobiota bacterium]